MRLYAFVRSVPTKAAILLVDMISPPTPQIAERKWACQDFGMSV